MNPYFKTPPAVKNLIIANSLIFLATYLIPSINSLLGQYGALYWIGSPFFHSYQFVSYMFLHGSFSHLFFNMFALFMFGNSIPKPSRIAYTAPDAPTVCELSTRLSSANCIFL